MVKNNISADDKNHNNRDGYDQEGINGDFSNAEWDAQLMAELEAEMRKYSEETSVNTSFYNETKSSKKSNCTTEYNSIIIGLASPHKIYHSSYGEVENPETINPRTLQPEKGGLFCERIFGTTKDWECKCGKYKKIRYKGKVCERCGVEITRADERRKRMGHIELAAPVAHIWYHKPIALLLDISITDLQKVLYFKNYIVIYPGDTNIREGLVLNENEYIYIIERYGDEYFKAGKGAKAIRELLHQIDLDKLCEELRSDLKYASEIKRNRILQRLQVAEAFRNSGNKPEWMILDVIPVLPPELRPMFKLDNGRFATSDLNELYKRVIKRNNRVKKLGDLQAPQIIFDNEKRMLQEAVDALFDNGRHGKTVTGPNNRPLRSLSDMLKGRNGHFRQNLLGKYVDYSGCSVVVVDPGLKLNQCGLPKEMAIELFKPFIIKQLCDLGKATNLRAAREMVEAEILKKANADVWNADVWNALEDVIKDHPVILSHPPTLSKLGIQSFHPILVEGKAIKLSPLIFETINLGFDSDQIIVHVPLSAEAQEEARTILLASNNLLKPSNGKPVVVPTQEMLLGSYYLTLVNPEAKGNGKAYINVDEAMMAYEEGDLSLQAPVRIRMSKEVDGKTYTKLLKTTLGKVIFNSAVPQNLGFIDRSNPENLLKLEIDEVVNKDILTTIIERCIKAFGSAKASLVLDSIKAVSYKYATQSGISGSDFEPEMLKKKNEFLAQTEELIDDIEAQYQSGLLSEEEHCRSKIKTWETCTRMLSSVHGEAIASYPASEADAPKGISSIEYFLAARNMRKKLTDTLLVTADSAYLTRRLIEVSQDVIIRNEDCHCNDGLEVYDITDGKNILEPLSERLAGRFLIESFCDDKTGEIICDTDTMIDDEMAKRLANIVNSRPDIENRKIKIRSPLTCECDNGMCAKCYGSSLATSAPAPVGEPAGIIAAQSLGEPGTKLTRRTFISQDFPTLGSRRIEELLECRKPGTSAILSEISGTASFKKSKYGTYVVISDDDYHKESLLPFDARLCQDIREGAYVEKGQQLTEGTFNPHDILAIRGINAVHDYLTTEIQKVYRMHGFDVNDKHIEVIVRQMLKKVKVETQGSTKLISGTLVEKHKFHLANQEAEACCQEKGIPFVPATASPVLLGITKASLATESFLSAAAFQEATKILAAAAIKGKPDPLNGIKENVIIGRLIPAGTGMSYQSR